MGRNKISDRRNTKALKGLYTNAKNSAYIENVKALRASGMSLQAIADRLGVDIEHVRVCLLDFDSQY